MIKIKLHTLPQSIESLNKIIEKDIPIKLSYKLIKLYKKLTKEVEQYEESRMKLINKYGEKKEDGQLNVRENGIVTINPENMQKFQQELLELGDIDIEMEFNPIKLEELEDAGVAMSPKHLMMLDEFIVE